MDTLDGANAIGEGFYLLGVTADGYDLEAMVMVEVDMLGGDDYLLVVMLDVRYLAQELAVVVIVKECDGAGHLLIIGPFTGNQFPPYKVPDGFRPVVVEALLDVLIEAPKEVFFQRNAKSNQFRHRITEKKIDEGGAKSQGIKNPCPGRGGVRAGEEITRP